MHKKNVFFGSVSMFKLLARKSSLTSPKKIIFSPCLRGLKLLRFTEYSYVVYYIKIKKTPFTHSFLFLFLVIVLDIHYWVRGVNVHGNSDYGNATSQFKCNFSLLVQKVLRDTGENDSNNDRK